ncbi:MAG: PfkB family carbohydrate kinase [bacterium]|nr:PfkB family carbohydrate kinase [bacterium]
MILGFGEALIDVLPSGEVVGGAPLNFSIRAAELASRMAVPVGMLSRVGQDQRGQRIQDLLHSRNVLSEGIQVDPVHPTGYVDVQLEHGEATYTIGTNVAWDHIAWSATAARWASQARLICFGSLAQRSETSRDTLSKMLDDASQAIKIFDINLRRPLPELQILKQGLARSNVLKCNESELNWLAEHLPMAGETAETIASELRERFGLDYVFWTRGKQGCVLQDAQDTVDFPIQVDLARFSLPHENADTVGAGDATSAALAVGLLQDWPAARIVRAANLCGAYAANSQGATAELPMEFIDWIFQEP